MAWAYKPCGAGGVDSIGVRGDAVVLGVVIALTIMGAAYDDGMSDVTTDEVDENMLSYAELC